MILISRPNPYGPAGLPPALPPMMPPPFMPYPGMPGFTPLSFPMPPVPFTDAAPVEAPRETKRVKVDDEGFISESLFLSVNKVSSKRNMHDNDI